VLERSFVWANVAHAFPTTPMPALCDDLERMWVADMILVNARKINQEKTKQRHPNGTMIVKSELTAISGGKLALTRPPLPSTKEAAYCEKYV